ncbi:DnaD domain-containing protein [Streptococcus lutetiensis]|uniref:DnaD domain-containing protein n=1 Tax=Streptococcus lutetiensis TaxID=150055 RepID=UPI001186801F|nr:DnaD domain protein [Streptococcus lutetiensis]
MTDEFLELPPTTQTLYFFLNLEADDDGFVGNPKTIMRLTGTKNDDMKLLLDKNYVILFQSGVVVITDWLEHNSIRKDRKKDTRFIEEKRQISIDNSGKYTWLTDWQPYDNQVTTKMQPNGCIGEDRIGKDRIGKDRIGKDRIGKENINNATADFSEIYSYYQQEIGVLSPNQAEQLADYIKLDNFEPELLKRAIDKASNNAKRSFGYVNSILRNWKQNGITTLVQAEEEDRKFQESKRQPAKSDIESTIPDDLPF